MQAIIFVVGVIVSFMVLGGFILAVYSEFDREFRKKEYASPEADTLNTAPNV
jgi:hypothetical protein